MHSRVKGAACRQETYVLDVKVPDVHGDISCEVFDCHVVDNGTLELARGPVDEPVNMVMSRVNLIDVTVGRVVNLGVVRNISRDVS